LVTDDGQAIVELAISQDIKAALHLLLSVFVADAAESHLIVAVLLGKAFLAHLDLNLLAYFVSLLFVLVAHILVNETLWVLDLHIYWVVHETIILHCDGQLLAVVLAVDLGLGLPCADELFLLALVVKLAANGVEVIALPVGFGGLGLHDLIVAFDFGIVVLSVLVRHHVVLARDVQPLVFVFLAGGVRGGALLWWLEVVLLHVDV